MRDLLVVLKTCSYGRVVRKDSRAGQLDNSFVVFSIFLCLVRFSGPKFFFDENKLFRKA